MARYRILPPSEIPPVLKPFEKKTTDKKKTEPHRESELSRVVLPRLQRLEEKIDRVLELLERETTVGGYPYQAEVVNIGAGGANLLCHARHAEGDWVDLCIYPAYGQVHTVYAIGQVIWAPEPEVSEAEGLIHGVEFVEIDAEDQDAIVRAVFQAERRLKNRDDANGGRDEDR